MTSKKPKTYQFSPWQIKEASFDADQDQSLYKYSEKYQNNGKVGKNNIGTNHCQENNQLDQRQQNDQKQDQLKFNKKIRNDSSYSNNSNYKQPDLSHNTISTKKMNTSKPIILNSQLKRSFSIKCSDNNNLPKEKQQKQKWKQLTILSSRQKLIKKEYLSKDKKLCNQYPHTSQTKSRRSSCNGYRMFDQDLLNDKEKQDKNYTFFSKQKEKPVLQEVTIKNFIIQGHYTQKQSFGPASSFSKRRQTNTYVLKQKFADLKVKKTISTFDTQNSSNLATINNSVSNKKVIIKGTKQKQNLFNVIKLQREINNNKMIQVNENGRSIGKRML